MVKVGSVIRVISITSRFITHNGEIGDVIEEKKGYRGIIAFVAKLRNSTTSILLYPDDIKEVEEIK